MPDPIHLRPADARVLPWKNGRGSTSELALWPPGASFERSDFDWRISKASVEEDGPFSSFTGFERVLVVAEGKGLVLDHGSLAPRARVERLVPYRFSGDWPTRAELVDGRVADFNVICRRGVVSAEIEVWEGRVESRVKSEPGEQLFFHLISGNVEVRDALHGCAWQLAGGESLWLRGSGCPELSAIGDARVLSVALRSHT